MIRNNEKQQDVGGNWKIGIIVLTPCQILLGSTDNVFHQLNYTWKMHGENRIKIIRQSSSSTMSWIGVSTHGRECIQSFGTSWE